MGISDLWGGGAQKAAQQQAQNATQQTANAQNWMNKIWSWQQPMLGQLSQVMGGAQPSYNQLAGIAQYRLGVQPGGAGAGGAAASSPTYDYGKTLSGLNALNTKNKNGLGFTQEQILGNTPISSLLAQAQQKGLFSGWGSSFNRNRLKGEFTDLVNEMRNQQERAQYTASPYGPMSPAQVPWYFQVEQPGFTDQQRSALSQMQALDLAEQQRRIQDQMNASLARRGLTASSLGVSQMAGLENWLAKERAREAGQLTMAEMARTDQQRQMEQATTQGLLQQMQSQQNSLLPLVNAGGYANTSANLAGQASQNQANYANQAQQASQNFLNTLIAIGGMV